MVERREGAHRCSRDGAWCSCVGGRSQGRNTSEPAVSLAAATARRSAVCIINFKPEKPNKKFLKRIFDTKPITPKHEPPPPLKKGYAAREKELQFFSDFAEFANVVNWHLASEYNNRPWRLQELPEVDLSLHGDFSGGPVYGRTYAIFHNQERVGALEICNSSQYSAEKPRVITYIQLEFVRLFRFDVIRTFLIDIADHTCDLFEPRYPRGRKDKGVHLRIMVL